MAMRHRITETELRDSIYTHASSTEAFNELHGTIVRADRADESGGVTVLPE